MDTFIQIFTATDKKEDAERIARSLVEMRLAGCVQIIGPVMSIYRWKGQIETAGEWLCLIKSHEDRYGAIEEAILSLHPYETPEIISLPIIAGSVGYLDWLRSELTTAGPEPS